MSLLDDMAGSVSAQARVTAPLNTNQVITPLNARRIGLTITNNGTAPLQLSLGQAAVAGAGIQLAVGQSFGPLSFALHGALCSGQWQGISTAALVADVIDSFWAGSIGP